MSRTHHPRLRSDSAISRYSQRRHRTALETYDFQVAGSFFVASYLAPRWLADVMYHVQQERWGRWVTIGTRPIGGPAAIKRSRMKSRQRMRDPDLERRNLTLSLEIRRRETAWQREDRDMYLGRDGARNVYYDDDLDDPRDRWGEDYCDDDFDPLPTDAEIVAVATYDLMQIADREAPHLANQLSWLLAELARAVAEFEPTSDRPLRWQLRDLLGIRGASVEFQKISLAPRPGSRVA